MTDDIGRRARPRHIHTTAIFWALTDARSKLYYYYLTSATAAAAPLLPPRFAVRGSKRTVRTTVACTTPLYLHAHAPRPR